MKTQTSWNNSATPIVDFITHLLHFADEEENTLLSVTNLDEFNSFCLYLITTSIVYKLGNRIVCGNSYKLIGSIRNPSKQLHENAVVMENFLRDPGYIFPS